MDLTIVMYHYVRPLADSRLPGIKGMEAQAFAQQVEGLLQHYTPVSVPQVLACL